MAKRKSLVTIRDRIKGLRRVAGLQPKGAQNA